MALALGWYGPLIDLSEASSHIGDFVQLLLFVHRSAPFQCRSSKGRSIIRTDIQVGDDTRQYFGVSVWQKSMGSMISVGDVILLQNVKIVKFGDIVEARTVQWSSLLCLIHPYGYLSQKLTGHLPKKLESAGRANAYRLFFTFRSISANIILERCS
ncbi:uncharacterized protein LOC129301594 isoform X3 [Prosopis cineraria]|uniref:uncharacterized protein LOC129301594 isoform X3 n=1 Tax=Prosopis cineraria TaxID=364024 RepID=UPI00240FCAC0|nr:uncharacterized protein LOC129301594 isoform X3 [Prosopis cineraria]XP_054796130.1 uncharacterized protein LOC129301594 isoform X3 [Prosopis cineraria]